MAVIEQSGGWVDGKQQMVMYDTVKKEVVGFSRYVSPTQQGFQTPIQQHTMAIEQQKQADALRRSTYATEVANARANAPEIKWPEGYGPSGGPTNLDPNKCTPYTWRDPYTGISRSNVSSDPNNRLRGEVKYPTMDIAGKTIKIDWLGPTGRAGDPIQNPGNYIGAVLPTPGDSASSDDWSRYGSALRSLGANYDYNADLIWKNSVSTGFDQTWGRSYPSSPASLSPQSSPRKNNVDPYSQSTKQSKRSSPSSINNPLNLNFNFGSNSQPKTKNQSTRRSRGVDFDMSSNFTRLQNTSRNKRRLNFDFEDWF